MIDGYQVFLIIGVLLIVLFLGYMIAQAYSDAYWSKQFRDDFHRLSYDRIRRDPPTRLQ